MIIFYWRLGSLPSIPWRIPSCAWPLPRLLPLHSTNRATQIDLWMKADTLSNRQSNITSIQFDNPACKSKKAQNTTTSNKQFPLGIPVVLLRYYYGSTTGPQGVFLFWSRRLSDSTNLIPWLEVESRLPGLGRERFQISREGLGHDRLQI